MRRRISNIWLMLVVSLVILAPALAEKVTIEVTGVVDIIRTNGGFDLDGSINLGSVMNGSCIYDAEATPQESDWNFIYPIISASINLGNYTFTYIPTPSDPHVGFRVGYDGGYHYSISSGANLDGEIIIDGVPQPFDNNAGGAFFDFMNLAIGSEGPDPGPPYNLPNPFPDFLVFDLHEFRVGFGYPLPTVNDYFDIYGEITSLTVTPEPATTYYVDVLNGDDNNDGLSPETAFATIQKAINMAYDGDTVLVAPGTYTGPGNRDINFYGLAITVRSKNGPENCIIDCQGGGRGFNFRSGEDANCVLSGFTITNGYAYDGGGIYCRGSSPTITNCIITGNHAEGNGSGMFYEWCDRPIINNCTITGNSAEGFGGGIFYRSCGDPTITNCTISGNSAGYDGGGLDCWFSNLNISNSTITGNSAGCDGGGIACGEGNPSIANCTISGNSAHSGGGIYCGSPEDDTSPTVINCTITGNSARYGGGIHCYQSTATITNCTYAENSATNGNTLACDSWSQSYPSNVQMTNCILWDGGDEIWNNDGSTITVTYSDVQGSWPGEGNIDADPCFVEAGYWADVNDTNIIVEPYDLNAVWIEGDYHLLRTSPCIDAANDANVYTDIEGNIRPFDFPGVDNNGELPEFDMGAYEATAEEAELLILPRVINRHSRSKRIMALLRLPEGITRDQIDRDSPLVLYPPGSEASRQFVFQYRRGSQRTNIFAFFDKAELTDAVGDNDSVELQVVGQFVSPGQYFYGSDTVRIKGRRGRARGHR